MKKNMLKAAIAFSLAFGVVSVGVSASSVGSSEQPVEGMTYHLERLDNAASQPGLCGAVLDLLKKTEVETVGTGANKELVLKSLSKKLTFGSMVSDQQSRTVPFTYQSDDGITVNSKFSWKISHNNIINVSLGSCTVAIRLVPDA